MSRDPFILAVALLLIASGAVGAPERKPPTPGPNFPTLESYYPEEARRAGQEGSTVIHICVDTNGKLTSAPAVAFSSGSDVLDSAAVNLANAGNGLYVPGSLGGVAQVSCGEFRIKFEMRADPLLRMANFRTPTLTARIEAISTDYDRRWAQVEKMVDKPKVDMIATANAQTVQALRHYTRGLEAALDQGVVVMADMLGAIEELGQSPDVPENERKVFAMVWPNERAIFAHRFRQALSDSRNAVRSVDELADYIIFSASRRPRTEPNAKTENSSQDAQLEMIRNQVWNALSKLESSVEALSKLSKPPAAAGNEPH